MRSVFIVLYFPRFAFCILIVFILKRDFIISIVLQHFHLGFQIYRTCRFSSPTPTATLSQLPFLCQPCLRPRRRGRPRRTAPPRRPPPSPPTEVPPLPTYSCIGFHWTQPGCPKRLFIDGLFAGCLSEVGRSLLHIFRPHKSPAVFRSRILSQPPTH